MIRPAGTQPTPEVIRSCIQDHQREIPRLDRLYRYYKGEHNIMSRKADNPLAPNNRVVAPNAYYITTVANGFTFANPLAYSGDSIDNLVQENKLAKTAAHDAEIGEDLSIFGRAYELVYMSQLPSQHVKLNHLDPRGSFVVFSNEIDPEPMFAVYYYRETAVDGRENGWKLNVYDGAWLYLYHLSGLYDLPELESRMPHYAGQVPIVEYKNNDEGIGDYERVLTLIDAYDRLQSDRLDDKDQFVDAILAVYGARLMDDADQAPEVVKLLHDYKIMDDLDKDARIEYIKKALDETSVEVLRQAIKSDISKFSLVPELTDENFAGNASGVAMEFKTLGLKWLANIKRRMFKKSLDRRLQVMNSYMTKLGRGFDWTDVDITFDDALPVDVMSYLPYAKDTLSRKTLVSFFANKFGVADVEKELVQIAQEQADADRRNKTLFDAGGDFGESAGGDDGSAG
ncbi:phage portal protein [Clostridium sp. D33t1_170424_F3]|uniref:phage portal protein n=1 Tax=Clostridium sp. D33t1_170424_F3 TaxID=2787099 RepID=UPI0018A8E442|nr:phage portal protein [Clostridium sp. D33t1_170424_F3]